MASGEVRPRKCFIAAFAPNALFMRIGYAIWAAVLRFWRRSTNAILLRRRYQPLPPPI